MAACGGRLLSVSHSRPQGSLLTVGAAPASAAAAAAAPAIVQSYYGAALCVCWSPDAAFVASGGEDDLVSTYSIAERQVGGRVQWVQLVVPTALHCSLADKLHQCSKWCW